MKEKENGGGASAWVYPAILAVLFFSGFGQMPIFKRYYLADIPGMAWSADFYITHLMHYLGAAALLALLAYILVSGGRLGGGAQARALTRALVLAVLTVSGVVLVVKNLSGWYLPPALIVAANLAHIAGAMLLLALGAFFVLRRPSNSNIGK